MDWTLWGSLVLFTLAGGVTPGPNNIILMSMGIRYGFRKCLPYIAGVAIGFAILLTAAILLFVNLPDANAFNSRVERIFIENDLLREPGQVGLNCTRIEAHASCLTITRAS